MSPQSSDSVPSLIAQHLWRGDSADGRAQVAETRLIRVIAEWNPGAGVDIVVASNRRGNLRWEIRPVGAVSAHWRSEIAFALEPIARVTNRNLRPLRSTRVDAVELVRDPARTFAPLREDDVEGRERTISDRHHVAWPESSRNHQPMLPMLTEVPGASVRTIVTAPEAVEVSMLRDEVLTTWDRFGGNLDMYLGSVTTIRTFVMVPHGSPGLARLRSVARGWGHGLVFIDAPEDLLAITPESLVASHTRPEGWAQALLRLPACGPQPVIGIKSVDRPVRERPIDHVPSTAGRRIKFGTASTMVGGRVAATLPVSELTRHVAIEGATGTGKTTLLTQLVAELSRNGVGVTVLDHHGSGVDAMLGALAPQAAADAVVVRHSDLTHPDGLNLFDCDSAEDVELAISGFTDLMQQIFDPRMEGIVGPRWRRWFTLLGEAVYARWGKQGTLLHLVALASDVKRVRNIAHLLRESDPELSTRLRNEIADIPENDSQSLSAWAISKFQPLVSQRRMRNIVGRTTDSHDVDRLLRTGGTLLIDLAGPEVGAEGARMLGAIWLLKHWIAMGRREDRTREHVIIVDEARLMTIGALPAMLAEARKFGIGVVIATQTIDELAPSLARQIEANVNTHFTFRVGVVNAMRASARLNGWDPAELTRLPDLRSATTFGLGGKQTDPFLLTVTRPSYDARIAQMVEGRCATARQAGGPIVPITDAAVAMEASPARRTPPPRPGQTRSAEPPADENASTMPSYIDSWLATRDNDAAAVPMSPAD